MSALRPKADMFSVEIDVCFVPLADMKGGKRYTTRHIRAHGSTAASINSNLSALQASGDRNHANGRLRGLLRLQRLRRDN
jgi:hypothetical protein